MGRETKIQKKYDEYRTVITQARKLKSELDNMIQTASEPQLHGEMLAASKRGKNFLKGWIDEELKKRR